MVNLYTLKARAHQPRHRGPRIHLARVRQHGDTALLADRTNRIFRRRVVDGAVGDTTALEKALHARLVSLVRIGQMRKRLHKMLPIKARATRPHADGLV